MQRFNREVGKTEIGGNTWSVMTSKPRENNVLGKDYCNYVMNFWENEWGKHRIENRIWHLRDFWLP